MKVLRPYSKTFILPSNQAYRQINLRDSAGDLLLCNFISITPAETVVAPDPAVNILDVRLQYPGSLAVASQRGSGVDTPGGPSITGIPVSINAKDDVENSIHFFLSDEDRVSSVFIRQEYYIGAGKQGMPLIINYGQLQEENDLAAQDRPIGN